MEIAWSLGRFQLTCPPATRKPWPFVRKTAYLQSVAAVSLAFACAGAASARAEDPKPFWTTATKLVGPASADKQSPQVRIRPTKDGLEAPFWDVPFAFHVPVEIRHESGPVRVTWRVTVSWDSPPAEWRDNPWGLSRLNWGIYRMDGRALDAAKFGNSCGQKWEADVPVPALVFTCSGPGTPTEKTDHKAFVGEGSTSLVMNPAEPGWYAVWYTFQQFGWLEKDPKRAFVNGTIHIDTLVARGETMPSTAEIDYLFGRGKRPDKMQEDKFYKVSTTNLPFRLRRDGWEFDHAELRVAPDQREKVEKKRVATGGGAFMNYEFEQKLGGFRGKDVEARIVERSQRDPRGAASDSTPDNDALFDTVYVRESKWKASFPQSLPDNGFGILTFAGGRQGSFKQKPAREPGYELSGYDWEPTQTDIYKEKSSTEKEKSKEYQEEVLAPMARALEASKAEIQKQFLDKWGRDAGDSFVPGFYENVRAGPAKGETPFQYVIRGLPLTHRKDADPIEFGPYPLLAYHLGPWTLIGYYKRLSEIENRVVASNIQPSEATIVSDTDKFWEWYVELTAVLEEQIPKATAAQINATQEAAPLQSLIKTRDRLLLSLQEDSGPKSRGVQRIWNAKDRVWEWADNEFPKLNIGTLPGGSEPGSVNTPVKPSAEIAQRIQKKVQELTAQINEHRKDITQFTAEARAAYEKVNVKLEEGNQRFGGPAHGELWLWRRHYRETYEKIPIEIALVSKDPELLRQAFEQSTRDGTSASTFVLEAQLHLTGGDSISAVEALRRALTLDRDHVTARQMLADAEVSFLQRAIDKSQGAIAQARHHFYGYLMERGFSDRAILPTTKLPLDWLASRISIYAEDAWAIFTTGLFGSFSAFYGKPAAEAELLATTERQMTTAFVGLHTMRLLRKNGVTFQEMKKMTSTEVRDKLGMRDRGGQPLSDAAAANIGVAIREAMKLPDVQALVAGNTDALREGMKLGYWDSTDVSNTWIEYFGDVTSAYNLFTLLVPAAKAGTAGRTMKPLVWTQAEARMMGELQALGQVTSGTEAVSNAIGLSRRLNALGATSGGKKVLNYLRHLDKYQAGLGAFDTAIWTTGKITGALTFGYVTVSATEQLAGHKAAMLVGAAMLFATDTELLVKLLQARNIPPSAIARVIISDYLPATKVHLKRLAQTEMTAGELKGLFERVKQGNKLAQADLEFLDKHFGTDWGKLIPGALPSENAVIPLLAAGKSARTGVDNGAINALEKLKPGLKAESEATVKTLQEEQKVVDALNAAQTEPNPPIAQQPAPPPNGPPVEERPGTAPAGNPPVVERPGTAPVGNPPVVERPTTTKFGDPDKAVAELPPPRKPQPAPPPTPEYPPSSQRILPEETKAERALGGYLTHPPVRETSRTAEAMQLLNNGQYAAAERKFTEIQELIRDGVLTEAGEMTMERLHLYRMTANDLQRVTRKTPTARSPVNDPLPAGTVDQVLDTPGLLKEIKDSTGAMSDVFNVEGRSDLFVKRVRKNFERYNKETKAIEQVEINVMEDVENNLIHEQLARAMGFDVPAMEVRIIYDANGNAVEAYYVMRKVEGQVLSEMSAGEIYLYREELARHRALATLMGDFDRKLDNYIITKDGHFVPIDAGMADVSSERLIRECAKEGIEYRPDLPFTIDGFYGRDHWYAKAVAKTPGGELLTAEKTLFRKLLVAEEAMTFQGAEATVIEIEKYFVNGAKAAEAEKLISDAYKKMHLDRKTKKLAELKGVNPANPAARAALEQEVLNNAGFQGEIRDAAAKVKRNFDVRAPHLRGSMKGLNKRNGIPLFETDLSLSSPLRFDSNVIIPFPQQCDLTTACLLYAA
jgi:hypothetical protein